MCLSRCYSALGSPWEPVSGRKDESCDPHAFPGPCLSGVSWFRLGTFRLAVGWNHFPGTMWMKMRSPDGGLALCVHPAVCLPALPLRLVVP